MELHIILSAVLVLAGEGALCLLKPLKYCTPKTMSKKKDSCCEGNCACKGMRLQPLGDRVVVRRETAEEKTKGGLYLPDTAKDKPARGTVVSIGDGKILDNGKRTKFQIKDGDKVLFLAYAGEEFKMGDDELLLMRESDVLAVIS
ncbi:MAG: co-chaperone GroES [Thermoguttaceae bacterium]